MDNINYSNYSITIEIKKDLTIPNNQLSLENCTKLYGSRILKFGTVKNCYDLNCVPLNELILTDLNESEFFAIMSGLILLEINIYLNGTKVYKNIYKPKSIKELNENSKTNFSIRSVQIILESMFIFNISTDINLDNISLINYPNFKNLDNYINAINYFKKIYGDGITSYTNINNSSKTILNSYYFSLNFSNLEHLILLIYRNRISVSPTIFGIDESYPVDNGTLKTDGVAEIITLDLEDTDGIKFLDSKVIEFLKTDSYSMSNAQFIHNYYSYSYIKNYILSTLRYKNTRSNEVYELPPLLNTKIENYIVGGEELNNEMYSINDEPSYFEIEGNLSKLDVIEYRNNILKFYNRNPKIYKIDFSKAPLELFKLGRKTDLGRLNGNSIIIAAEVNFNFSNDIDNAPGKIIDDANHLCSGSLFLLNWK